MVGIYKITSPSGKIYIGQSTNISQRFNYYKKLKCKNQPLLFKSFMKYGVDSHVLEIIHELDDYDQNVLNKLEFLYWRLYLDRKITMLNLRVPGNEGSGFCSEEVKAKISKKNKGVPKSEEFKENLRKFYSVNPHPCGNDRRTHTDETKKKISQTLKGRKYTPETINKLKNKIVTYETRLKMSKALTKRLEKKVDQFNKEGVFIKTWGSMKEAYTELKLCRNTMSLCTKNKVKSCGGFVWKLHKNT